MDSLEFSWDENYKTLSLDTSENFALFRSDIHRLFDENTQAFVLLPSASLVEMCLKALGRKRPVPSKFPKLEGDIVTLSSQKDAKLFKYRLIDIPGKMESVLLTREHGQPDAVDNVDSLQNHDGQDAAQLPSIPTPVVHSWPFSNFPPVFSHTHPRFMILNGGYKLAKISGAQLETIRHVYRENVVTLIFSSVQLFNLGGGFGQRWCLSLFFTFFRRSDHTVCTSTGSLLLADAVLVEEP
ncbi:hypothetical protein BDV98DRAFT_655826 [Pterulicium gracile]|uniref:Uncharacterized protein n=1 Tax=Pterulicium gracile TaxID=1884261 RepID=A0A5C3QNV9_9AGAR|nr:hypothetical protein BDV98DRAFT_655826 [Pterula gracilis]